MIDLGISQLGLIAVVALVVIGPEKLPTVARTVGSWVGRARHYVNSVKSEMAQVTELNALRDIKNDVEQAAWKAEQDMQELGSITAQHGDIDEIETIDDAEHIAQSLGSPRPYADMPIERKNWRLKRHALPYWYRVRHGTHARTQSSAIRVARQRPSQKH